MAQVITIPSPTLPRDIPQTTSPIRPERIRLNTHTSGIIHQGSFDVDKVVKSGRVLKRTRKTKSWKPTYIVLRSHYLNMYRDESESKLRNQIQLSEVTAVARQRDSKRKEKHIFGVFTPSRNYHFEAATETDAQEWVEHIRQEARIYEDEDVMMLASPGGTGSAYQGFERAMDSRLPPFDEHGTGYSSSDVDNLHPIPTSSLPRSRARGQSNLSARQPSIIEYSGEDGRGSYSDLSEAAGPAATAMMSALSLSPVEGRLSTSSAFQARAGSVYGNTPTRPALGVRNPSQMSTGAHVGLGRTSTQLEQDAEKVIHQGWILLLKARRGVRSWKKVWMVLRTKGVALYKNQDEYRAILIIPFSDIQEAVDIDPISRSKEHCMQLICEERNYRLCASDGETLSKWLSSFKSLTTSRRAAEKDTQQGV